MRALYMAQSLFELTEINCRHPELARESLQKGGK
jgi:hypothetical protein